MAAPTCWWLCWAKRASMPAPLSASLPCPSAQRLKSKLWSKSDPMTAPMFPQPIAHRGLHERAIGIIENSASAFEAAIIGGFTIECDVQLSSDGVPVIFHDDDMTRLL